MSNGTMSNILGSEDDLKIDEEDYDNGQYDDDEEEHINKLMGNLTTLLKNSST